MSKQTLKNKYYKDMPFVYLDYIFIDDIPAILKELKDHTKVAISFAAISEIIKKSTGIPINSVLNIYGVKIPFGFYTTDKIVNHIIEDNMFELSNNYQGATIIIYTLLLYSSEFNEILRTSAWFKIILKKLKNHIHPTHEDIQKFVKTTEHLNPYLKTVKTTISEIKEPYND